MCYALVASTGSMLSLRTFCTLPAAGSGHFPISTAINLLFHLLGARPVANLQLMLVRSTSLLLRFYGIQTSVPKLTQQRFRLTAVQEGRFQQAIDQLDW
jgi:hypothetical protein